MAFDTLIQKRGYASRSEAVRDILRAQLQQRASRDNANGYCIGTLAYVYHHDQRDLSERLANLQHAHHDLIVATMRAHLDHEQCIETIILKGRARRVQELADRLVAEHGVRHGQLNLVKVDLGTAHAHGGSRHQHLRPKL